MGKTSEICAQSNKLQPVVSTPAYLIRGALFRPRPAVTQELPGRFSLQIRHVAELIDMYHTRKATDLRDKVYALLGMSSNHGIEAALPVDGKSPWSHIFRDLIRFFLSKEVSVGTWG